MFYFSIFYYSLSLNCWTVFRNQSESIIFRLQVMSATLQPYLEAVRHTLQAALCLEQFSSQVVERHNKPEVISNRKIIDQISIDRNSYKTCRTLGMCLWCILIHSHCSECTDLHIVTVSYEFFNFEVVLTSLLYFLVGSTNIKRTVNDSSSSCSKQTGTCPYRTIRQLGQNIYCYQTVWWDRENSVPQIHTFHVSKSWQLLCAPS